MWGDWELSLLDGKKEIVIQFFFFFLLHTHRTFDSSLKQLSLAASENVEILSHKLGRRKILWAFYDCSDQFWYLRLILNSGLIAKYFENFCLSAVLLSEISTRLTKKSISSHWSLKWDFVFTHLLWLLLRGFYVLLGVSPRILWHGAHPWPATHRAAAAPASTPPMTRDTLSRPSPARTWPRCTTSLRSTIRYRPPSPGADFRA